MRENDNTTSRTTTFGPTGTSVTVLPGRVLMYEITEQDLDFFASGMRSIFTGLSSSCIAVCISVSLLLALNWDTIPELRVVMLSVAISVGGFGLVFAGFAAKEFLSYKRKLRDFKRNAARQPTAADPEPSTPVGSGSHPASLLRMRRPDSR